MPDAPKPTIDERIKAIAESLELLTLHSRENFDKIHGIMNALAEAQVKTETRLDSLIRIVASHERRLDALEG